MENRTLPGKYAIATIVLLGVAAAVYSQIFNARLQRRALDLWGKRNAELMVNGPLANALLLGPADAKGDGAELERLMVGGEHFTVLAEKDAATKPGFSHLRQSLVNERSFDWSAEIEACRPRWKYALEFSDGNHAIMLLIAPNCGFVRLTETGATASMQPVMKGIVEFMQEQFPEKPEPPPAKIDKKP
jgi:hypothetical protein